MYNNEKSNDWVEVATAAGVLIPILIRILGGSSKK